MAALQQQLLQAGLAAGLCRPCAPLHTAARRRGALCSALAAAPSPAAEQAEAVQLQQPALSAAAASSPCAAPAVQRDQLLQARGRAVARTRELPGSQQQLDECAQPECKVERPCVRHSHPRRHGWRRSWISHRSFLSGRDIKGRIYLSAQGINAQFSGPSRDALDYAQWVGGQPLFQAGLLADWSSAAAPRQAVLWCHTGAPGCALHAALLAGTAV